jgi:hypothetical protein
MASHYLSKEPIGDSAERLLLVDSACAGGYRGIEFLQKKGALMLYRTVAVFLVLVLLSGVSMAQADRDTPAAQPELTVGDAAPDFTLKNHALEDVTLSELRGRKVILAFYVFAFTGG